MATATKPAKKSAKKAAKPKATKKAAPVTRERTGPTPNQLLILEQLVKHKELTRNDLKEKTGIQKGFSKLLGTQEDGGGHPTSLIGTKLVTVHQPPEGERGLLYTITASGRKAVTDSKGAKGKPAKAEKADKE